MKKILSYLTISAVAILSAGTGITQVQAANSYTAAQVATHNVVSNCWLIISNQVYDVTTFIPIHPGGNAIVPYCGTDATTIFDAIHNPTAFALLPTYLIGNLITNLTAPTNLAGTPTQTTVSLSWTASAGGAAPITYTIKRGGVSVGTTTTTSFTNSGLTPATAYSYTVMATDSALPTANTMTSAALSVTTLAAIPALTAPTNIMGTPGNTSIALSWTASTGGTAPITYTVLRNGVSVGTTASTSFTNTGLLSGTSYSYVIMATDSSSPTPASASSAAMSFTTTIPGPSPLTAPSNLAGTPTQTTAALTWTASTGGTAPITYSVKRNGTTVGTTTATSFTNSGLLASTTYSYVVMATDSASPTPASMSSSALSVTTLSNNPTPDTTNPTASITAPADKDKVSGTVTITATGSDNVGVVSMVLFIDGTQKATSSGSALSFAWDTTQGQNGAHTITVKAYDAAGNSGTSPAVKVVVQNGNNHGHEDGNENENENGNEHHDGNGNGGNGNGNSGEHENHSNSGNGSGNSSAENGNGNGGSANTSSASHASHSHHDD